MVTTAVSCFLLVLSVYGYLGYFPPLSASGTLAAPSSSWNPSVTCSPMVVTVEQILGTQANSMGGATENGSMFNPGITSPVGSAKRWLTPGPTPPGWVSRSALHDNKRERSGRICVCRDPPDPENV